jgi:hypothetical protein
MLSGQSMSLMLSAAGVVFIAISFLLILCNRVPSLKTPQQIKALGVELDVSVITVLVLVGFVLSLTSVYLQVKNYEGQIASTETKLEELNSELRHAGKVTFTPFVVLGGIPGPDKMPHVGDVICTFVMVDGGNTVTRGAQVSIGAAPNSLQVTMLDIPLSAEIRRIEITEKTPVKPRSWVVENVGYPLAPALILNTREVNP